MKKTLMIGTAAILFAGSAMAMSWDTDGDGQISQAEFMAAPDRDEVFNALDTDNDGRLSAEEYAVGKWMMFDQDADNAWDENEFELWTEKSAAVQSGQEQRE